MLRHFTTFALLLAGMASVAQGYDIVLRSEAVVVESIVRLGDLAEVVGPSQRYVQELEKLELFPAPSLNRTRFVTINDIRAQLTARGFRVEDLYFSGASRTRIARTDAAAPSTTLVDSARTAARDVQQASWNGRPLDEGEVLLVHTVRPIRRGEVIRVEDLTVQPLNLVRSDGDFETQIESLVGKEAVRSLPALRPIPSDSVREPIVIQQNEVVTVIAQIGGLIIRRDAIATDDACVGQLLTVQAISPEMRHGQKRGELFQVRVTGPGQAMTLNSDKPTATTATIAIQKGTR